MAGFLVVIRAANGRFYARSRNPRGRIRFTRQVGRAAAFPTHAEASRVARRFRATRPTTTFRVEAL